MDDKFPEAGAVVFTSYKRTDGFIINLTLRDKTGKDVLDRIDVAITKIKEQGGVPYERTSGFPKKEKPPVEYVEGRVCPLDQGKLIKPPTGTNRPIKCENNAYDFQTKISSGCQFKEWPQSAGDIPERQIHE